MAAETRIGIVAGLLIVIIASVYFFRSSGSRDDELLVSNGSRITVAQTATDSQTNPDMDATKKMLSTAGDTADRTTPSDPAADKLQNRLALNRPAKRNARPPRQFPGPLSPRPNDPPTATAAPANDPPPDARDPATPVKLRTEPSTDLVEATWKNILGTEADEPAASPGGADLATVSDRIRRGARAPLRYTPTDDLTPQSLPKPGQPTASTAKSAEPPIWRRLTGTGAAPRSPAEITNPWPRKHVIDSGDTLEEIALDHYGDRAMVSAILAANPSVKGPKHLRIGHELTLPAPPRSPTARIETRVNQSRSTMGGQTYIVQAGDTLYAIAAQKLGSGPRWEEILKLNADVLRNNPKRLSPGMTLRLPPAGSSR